MGGFSWPKGDIKRHSVHLQVEEEDSQNDIVSKVGDWLLID